MSRALLAGLEFIEARGAAQFSLGKPDMRRSSGKAWLWSCVETTPLPHREDGGVPLPGLGLVKVARPQRASRNSLRPFFSVVASKTAGTERQQAARGDAP